ncbi:flagellar biosynthesis protein FlhB [Alicyclobacillus tolerans]|uniref:flagellar biosynthesis protein FlhB n=1 Tax=Alicyclobacillus tolerans TaxID=90970 RepID=UPI003B7941E6
MLILKLQRFAESDSGNKTEKATPRRRQEARREGNVPKSVELTSSIMLLGALAALRILGPKVWEAWQILAHKDLTYAGSISLTAQNVPGLFGGQFLALAGSLLPLLLVFWFAAAFTGFVQVGPLFLPKLLLPKWERIQPIAGLRRLFSPQTAMEGLKSILKLAIVVAAAYMSLHQVTQSIGQLSFLSVNSLIAWLGSIVFRLSITVAVLMILLSALDFYFQKSQYEKKLRMTKHEVREEFRQTEGDPQIKSNIRRRARALAMRRMMQDIPKADVVITNPTHYAVAIWYRPDQLEAPQVLAKGQDYTAQKIRELAEQHHVAIVENPPLARTLYRDVEIGQVIPAELYQAVAEVLAYVYAMKQQKVFTGNGVNS